VLTSSPPPHWAPSIVGYPQHLPCMPYSCQHASAQPHLAPSYPNAPQISCFPINAAQGCAPVAVVEKGGACSPGAGMPCKDPRMRLPVIIHSIERHLQSVQREEGSRDMLTCRSVSATSMRSSWSCMRGEHCPVLGFAGMLRVGALPLQRKAWQGHLATPIALHC
jgi:hypothetical protein